MPLWLAIIIAILLLGFLIFIHELGHFMAARKNGVRVDEFAVGFGPALLKKKIGDTVWFLKLIPLGGYVKLYGEDAHDGKALKAKDSFASKTPWQRIEIICAGVLMNLLVAIVLLTVGIGLGMDPLISSADDFWDRISAGELRHEVYLELKNVDSAQADKFTTGDDLVEIDTNPVAFTDAKLVQDLFQGTSKERHSIVVRNSETGVQNEYLMEVGQSFRDLGFDVYAPAVLARPKVVSVNDGFSTQLEVGDLILSLNDKAIVDTDVLSKLLLDGGELNAKILRKGEVVNIIVRPDDNFGVVGYPYISNLVEGGVAAAAGVLKDTYLLNINGVDTAASSAEVVNILRSAELPMTLTLLDYQGNNFEVEIDSRNDGKIGIYLTDVVHPVTLPVGIIFEPVLGSVVPNQDLKVAWHLAPFVAIEQTTKLALDTVKGFAGVVSGLLIERKVPDAVGGPVAVAQITTDFLRYDLPSTIWLVAVISLSLAVINILPIPALDGGRLLFVLIEVLRGGEKVKPKWEALVHTIGFFVLIILILLVTFNDISRLN